MLKSKFTHFLLLFFALPCFLYASHTAPADPPSNKRSYSIRNVLEFMEALEDGFPYPDWSEQYVNDMKLIIIRLAQMGCKEEDRAQLNRDTLRLLGIPETEYVPDSPFDYYIPDAQSEGFYQAGGLLYSIKKGAKETGKFIKSSGEYIWDHKREAGAVIFVVAGTALAIIAAANQDGPPPPAPGNPNLDPWYYPESPNYDPNNPDSAPLPSFYEGHHEPEVNITPQLDQNVFTLTDQGLDIAASPDTSDLICEEVSDTSSSPYETTALQAAIIEEAVSQFEEQPDTNLTTHITDLAKELGSHIAHETYDHLTEIASIVPTIQEGIQHLDSSLFPENSSDSLCDKFNELGDKIAVTIMADDSSFPHIEPPSTSPLDDYQAMVEHGHELIDDFFDTDQADRYTEETKANDPTVKGELPSPWGLSKIFKNMGNLLKAGKAIDRGGLSKAGRALAKHGDRAGSVFPKAVGNPKQINAQGERILESILNHPEKKILPGDFRRFGKVVDIHAPHGGVRYNANGELIGFLEPPGN